MEFAVIGGIFVLIAGLIWALVRRSSKAARAEQRSDALDANLEATRDAERHLDQGDQPLAARRAAAAERRLRRQRPS
jgi:hypothetical protein